MVCFILDRKTFLPLTQWDILTYDTMIDSVFDNTGSITVLGNVDYGNEGNFLTFDGNMWVISAVSPAEEQTRLTLLSVISAFSRELVYTPGQNAAERIIGALTDEYRDLSDPEYAMPYLNIIDTHTGTSEMQPDVEDGLWSLKSFIRKARRLTTLHVDFSLGAGQLNVSIYNATTPLQTVVFGDGHHLLQSSTYSKDSVAKITAIQGENVSDWYLAEDGTISTTIPANRAKGEWRVITVTDGDDVAEKVADEFSENSTSHKIEFWSDKKYNLNDNIRLLVNGSVVTSYIAYVGIRSTDDRYYYKSGELATTLVEKVQRVVDDIPAPVTETSQLVNDSGFVNEQEAANAAPVQSVNGATGDVTRSQLGCLSVDGDVYAVWIGSSYDLNDFFSGVVLCDSNVQNVPSADWWHITASGTTGTCVQLAAKLQNNGVMLTRNCAGGTWSAWQPLYGSGYKAGDTFYVGGYTPFAGFVTSGATECEISVITPKSMANISSVGITTMNGGIRVSSGGYLDGKSYNTAYISGGVVVDSSYTITAVKATDNIIRLSILKSSSFSNVTNNTPVVYAPLGGTTFVFS